MPFMIVHSADKGFCVFTQADDGDPKGDPHGCHPTRAEAVAQLRALYSAVPEARKDAEEAEGDPAVKATLTTAPLTSYQRVGPPDYEVRKHPDGRWCVYRAGTDDVVMAFGTEGEARAYWASMSGYGKAAEPTAFKNYACKATVQDEDQGIVHLVVSVFGKSAAEQDSDGDVVLKGAFARAIAAGKASGRLPKGVWAHKWDQPIAKTLDAWEGEDGLNVVAQMAMHKQLGRDAFNDIKHGFVDEYSFGYRVTDADRKDGARFIKDLDWLEWSPVLVGADRRTRTVAVKDGADEQTFPAEGAGTDAEKGSAEARPYAEQLTEAEATVERLLNEAKQAKAAVSDLVARGDEILERRQKEGRTLSQATVTRLQHIHTHAQGVYAGLGQMTELIAALLGDAAGSRKPEAEEGAGDTERIDPASGAEIVKANPAAAAAGPSATTQQEYRRFLAEQARSYGVSV